MHKVLNYFIFLLIITACKTPQNQINNMKEHPYTNALINESSPYLLQHAHNPVNWLPWSNEVFEKAKKENKLVLISIGYSACHWCHVMEKESFEDTTVAKVMNDNFICVKVDREEHPDVDQIYMDAVQLMTGNGGWPLNCITLPDGRPVYGGTYFPKNQWVKILQALAQEYKQNPSKFEEYAQKVTQGVKMMDVIPADDDHKVEKEILETALTRWKKIWDTEWGGNKGAPKFPMPVNIDFLLQYAHLTNDEEIHHQINLTLTKMALGGIYDQVEGGFMRYSTDSYWKVPHFEKMLYDNAQLLSTYANAFKAYKKPLYKKVVEQTYSFLINNFRSPNGGYYSAYDADSEGEEGKYYTWTEEELKTILTKEEFEIAKKIFQITPHQKWDGKYILWQDKTNEALAQQMHISADEFEEIREKIRQKLLKERRKRVKPGLDNKILASWNALLIKGFADAFTATGNTEFLTEAENIYSFIEKNYLNKKTLELVHIKSNKNAIEANLDDYALLIQAVIRLYEITLNEKYLITANQLTGFVNKHFTDEENTFYYYTSDTKAQNLIVRKKELSDNVIPSSNAVMAHNLHYLSIVMENETFENRVKKMTVSLQTYVSKVPSAYAMWASAITKEVFPFKETVIIGPKAIDFNIELNKNYVANVLWAGGKTLNNSIPILKDRGSLPETYIYICQNKTCKKPVSTIKEALELLN
jgi:hypothetical protein